MPFASIGNRLEPQHCIVFIIADLLCSSLWKFLFRFSATLSLFSLFVLFLLVSTHFFSFLLFFFFIAHVFFYLLLLLLLSLFLFNCHKRFDFKVGQIIFIILKFKHILNYSKLSLYYKNYLYKHFQ